MRRRRRSYRYPASMPLEPKLFAAAFVGGLLVAGVLRDIPLGFKPITLGGKMDQHKKRRHPELTAFSSNWYIIWENQIISVELVGLNREPDNQIKATLKDASGSTYVRYSATTVYWSPEHAIEDLKTMLDDQLAREIAKHAPKPTGETPTDED